MPTTKLNNGQLPTTISSKTIDSSNTINTDLTKLSVTGGTNGQVLSTNGSGTLSWATAGGGGGGGGDVPTFMVVKSADETVTNSDQAQNDDDLVFAAPAFNRPYYFEATIYVERSTSGSDQPGIKFAFGNTSAIQGLLNCVPGATGAPVWVFGAFAGSSTVFHSQSMTYPQVFKVWGTFRPLSSSAVLRFVWAQNTASATVGTVVKKGSKLLVWDLS